jgi:hypothetical protein
MILPKSDSDDAIIIGMLAVRGLVCIFLTKDTSVDDKLVAMGDL